eukprot:EG_transcript_8311
MPTTSTESPPVPGYYALSGVSGDIASSSSPSSSRAYSISGNAPPPPRRWLSAALRVAAGCLALAAAAAALASPAPPGWPALQRLHFARPAVAARHQTITAPSSLATRRPRRESRLQMAKDVRPWKEEEFGIQVLKDEFGGKQRILQQGDEPRPRMFTVAPGWAQLGPQPGDTVCQFQGDVQEGPERTTYCNGVWTSEGGDIPWVRSLAGSTPTSGTGPSAGPGGAPYLYAEASEPNHPAKAAVLTSAPGEYGGVVFRYHMCGATMGSLFVETLSAGEEEWDLVWVQDGRLQIAPEEPFATAYLKFPAVVQQVRFLAITGDSYFSDIALADVWLKHGPIPALPTGPYLLQSPKDAAKLLCLSAQSHPKPVLARRQCDKGNPTQWFGYEPSSSTLRQGEWCLGTPATEDGTVAALDVVECPPLGDVVPATAWACYSVRCCLQANPSVCLTLRPGGHQTLFEEKYGSFFPQKAGRRKSEEGIPSMWRS